jgi:TolB-like protein/DNA-binding winged helix-turn-helix (wHTH) protein
VIFEFDRFRVDDVDFRFSAGGVRIALEPKAFRLLLYLLQNPNRLVRKQELLDQIWSETNVTDSVLTRSIGILRRALDDDSREPRFIQTVPTAGYRFIADVCTREEQMTSAVATPVPVDRRGEKAVPPRRRSLVRAAVLAGGIAFLSAALGWKLEKRTHVTQEIHSLAVLPLENLSGDPAQDYFADGMTDQLITELARIRDLRVVSRTSVMQEKGHRKPLQDIASELRVDSVVEGSIVRFGNKIRITAQLIDVRNDRHLWAQSFEGSAGDVLSLQNSVAQEIASHSKIALLPAGHTARRVDPAAYDAYLRGRYFFDKQDFVRSTSCFERAISLDSSYASAYAGLAESLDAEPTFRLATAEEIQPKAIAAAQRAIELDPGSGEAYTALGSIQTIYQWNWTEAEQNLKRGVELSPSDSLSEMKYAAYLDAVGRTDEAVIHMRRALDLDPLSFFITRRLGVTLFYARLYPEALEVLHRASEMEPRQLATFEKYVSRVYEKQGFFDLAVDHDLSALREASPKADTIALRSVYKLGGWPAYWRARIESLRPYADRTCASYESGTSYVRSGDRDQAFFYLNRAVDRRCFDVTWLKVDPLLDPLRNDPRYKSLLRRLGLPG